MDETRFFGLPLSTAPGHVMTPRAASEQLVTLAVDRVGDGPARVADVGTGSGAIAVALALAAPRAEVWATDVSDLVMPVPGELDLIVANLPYLSDDERVCHPDLADEPDGAVFAAGDGLGPYRRLLAMAEQKLRPDGAVVIQLHRRAIVAERDAVSTLRATLPAVA